MAGFSSLFASECYFYPALETELESCRTTSPETTSGTRIQHTRKHATARLTAAGVNEGISFWWGPVMWVLSIGWRKNVAGVKMQPDSKNSSGCQVTKHLTNFWTLFAAAALINIIYAKRFGRAHTSLYRSYQMGVRYEPPAEPFSRLWEFTRTRKISIIHTLKDTNSAVQFAGKWVFCD